MPNLELDLQVRIEAIDDLHAACFVNGQKVGKITLETRLVEVTHRGYCPQAKDFIATRENRDVTRAYFRCPRDAFKRVVLTDLKRDATIATLETGNHLRSFVPVMMQAYLKWGYARSGSGEHAYDGMMEDAA